MLKSIPFWTVWKIMRFHIVRQCSSTFMLSNPSIMQQNSLVLKACPNRESMISSQLVLHVKKFAHKLWFISIWLSWFFSFLILLCLRFLVSTCVNEAPAYMKHSSPVPPVLHLSRLHCIPKSSATKASFMSVKHKLYFQTFNPKIYAISFFNLV